MRRFLIRNAAGEQVGEGVELQDGQWEFQFGEGEPMTVRPSPLLFFNDESDQPDALRGLHLEWLEV